jgi:hypothetical protein
MKKIVLFGAAFIFLSASNSYDSAKKSWAEAQLGYALSIVEACPELTLNPDGFGFPLEELMSGSTNNAPGNNYVDLNRRTSVGKLIALGDKACEAALDWEAGLGKELFLKN